MSDYHILETSDIDQAKVAYHFTVPPAEENYVGVLLTTAIVQYLGGGTITAVPWLEVDDPTEYAELQNGDKYEHVMVVTYDGNLSNGEKQAIIEAKHATLGIIILNRVRSLLKFWGYNGTIS